MTNYQHVLFPYAYNILGSSEDAKDAIQDVVINYVASKRADIRNEKNYLIKSVINQAIYLKNKKKKVRYADDVWLPEPFATEEADTNINLNEIASFSLLVLLERLSPKERAVYILKEGFSYSHEEIAEVLSSTVENSRKLLSRAKSKINLHKNPSPLLNKEKTSFQTLDEYMDAIRNRDTQRLEGLLTNDIRFFADGGTKYNVVQKRCEGAAAVASLMMYVYHTYNVHFSVVSAEVNHQPALLYYNDKQLISCQVFSIDNGKIHQINAVVDPEKLKALLPAKAQ